MQNKATKLDWVKFISVMIIFIIGMIVLMIKEVHNVWIWVGYIAVWTWAEMKIAKNIHLKWWVWFLIIAGLSLIDLFIISILNT